MANKKITELPTATTTDGSEYYEIVQGGVNKKVTVSVVSNWQGVWTFPASSFPTATRGGQQWYVNGDTTVGIEFFPDGTLLISKAAGTGTANFIKKTG